MAHHYDTYPVEIAGIKRDLRLFEVAPGVRKSRLIPAISTG